MKYDPPYNIEQIEKIYGRVLANRLLNDPVHRWRAETGIELLHREPSFAEQKRAASNWKLMTEKQKRISDEKSVELFGKKNLERLDELLAMHKHAGLQDFTGSAGRRLLSTARNMTRVKKYFRKSQDDDESDGQERKNTKFRGAEKVKRLFGISKCGE